VVKGFVIDLKKKQIEEEDEDESGGPHTTYNVPVAEWSN
jgi:hypothetical protein